MAKKFGSNEIFIAIEEEDPINSYHSDIIVQIGDNEDEAKVATKSLNIVKTFQVIVIVTPTRVKCLFTRTLLLCRNAIKPYHPINQPCISCEFKRSLS